MSIKKNQIANQNVSNSAIPLPVPANPNKWICVQMMIPDSLGHRAAFLGAISNLATWRVWQRDMAHNGTIVAQLWSVARRSIRFVSCDTPVIFPTFGEDDENMPALYEPYCLDDGTCGFHFRCDICGGWHDVALASATNAPNSPTNGAPQPPINGGTISVCKKLAANNTLLLDAPVSSGDTVTIISASGSGNDGGELQWRCPDGGTYFGGLCDDPAFSLNGGDPVPTSPHMSLILTIGGTGYPFYLGASPWAPVVITIPGGISNAYAEIQVNDSALGNNKGDYAICYEQKNNQMGSWSHTFNFTINQYGWAQTPGEQGVWVAGVGWSSTFGGTYQGVDLSFVLPTLTGAATYSGYKSQWVSTVTGDSGYMYVNAAFQSFPPTIGANTMIWSGAIANSATLRLSMADASHVMGTDGQYKLTSITLTGTGVDPF